MIFFLLKEDGNLETKEQVILIELFEIMKTKEEILSEKKKEVVDQY